MSKILLDLRRQAKGLIEAGKTSADVGVLLDIKPGIAAHVIDSHNENIGFGFLRINRKR